MTGVSLSFAVGGELEKVGVGSGVTPKASRHMRGGPGPPPLEKIFEKLVKNKAL